MFISAIIFLGLAFGFHEFASVNTTDGWYVIMAVEAVVICVVSAITPFLNFRRIALIERLGLLTLIILGEGMMSLGELVTKIQESDGIFSSAIIGMIISGVLIIYLLYMLYFDQTETKGLQVGSFRQQLWTLYPFPFHVYILLVVDSVVNYIAEGLDVEVPESLSDPYSSILQMYSAVYLYFFISTGLALVLLACIYVLCKKDKKTRVEWLSMGNRVVAGIALALLATMYVPFNTDNGNATPFLNFFESAWMPATVALIYGYGKSRVDSMRCRGYLNCAVLGVDVLLIAYLGAKVGPGRSQSILSA